MSGKHVALVLKSGKLKGNALLMAIILAHKAGTGKPFGNGKVIADGYVPKGPDKWLMKKMRVNRRESIRQWRKEVVASGLFTTKLVGQSDGWSVHSYQFSYASETAARAKTKTAARERDKNAESAALQGEVELPAFPASQKNQGGRREGSSSPTQRSAVQPCADEQTKPQKHPGLELTGYERRVMEAFKSWSRCTPEQIRRVAGRLPEYDLEPFLRWLTIRGKDGGVWLVGKTKSRLDWLADRLESSDDHSALSQFTGSAMVHDLDGGAETPAEPQRHYVEGEIDMDEEDQSFQRKLVSIKIEDV
jgi:hypothetical protein